MRPATCAAPLTTTATKTACRFVKSKVGAGHPFAGRSLADIASATDMLVVLVLRDGAHPVLPNGDTVIQKEDICW